MGFIKAFSGALSGTFADQWKEFYVPKKDVSPTAALFEAVQQVSNNGVGENYKGYSNVISNGSKFVVPEGTALITVQDGQITGFVAEPGGFEFRTDDPNSQSIFAGDGIVSPLIKSTWEKIKFGGQPATQQLAFYINLKEIAGIRFGTPSVIQWNDSFFETKVGAMARGTFSIKIVDPLLFVKNFVPVSYIQPGAKPYDFNDVDEVTTEQLLNEFVNSLSAGITACSMQAKVEGVDTYDYMSVHREEFGNKMGEEVENSRQWKTSRGLDIVNVTITLEYDEATKALLAEFQQDDKEIRKARRMGDAYANNMAGMMAAASASAMNAAAGNENGAMMGFMGINMAQQNGANLMGVVQNMQPTQPQTPVTPQASSAPVGPTEPVAPVEPTPAPQASQDPTTRLLEMKKLLDAGAITQEDYDKVKNQILGI